MDRMVYFILINKEDKSEIIKQAKDIQEKLSSTLVDIDRVELKNHDNKIYKNIPNNIREIFDTFKILYNKIQTLIKKGIDEGAKLVAGGPGKPEGLDKGYYVKPTVFADVNNNMEIDRTEIFGLVLSVIQFENEDEAIKIANNTPYGLTNYIQTQDKEKIKRVSRKVRSGMVDVNGAGIAVDAPFGGFKHSGIGREAGQHGLDEFLEVKAVGGWN